MIKKLNVTIRKSVGIKLINRRMINRIMLPPKFVYVYGSIDRIKNEYTDYFMHYDKSVSLRMISILH